MKTKTTRQIYNELSILQIKRHRKGDEREEQAINHIVRMRALYGYYTPKGSIDGVLAQFWFRQGFIELAHRLTIVKSFFDKFRGNRC